MIVLKMLIAIMAVVMLGACSLWRESPSSDLADDLPEPGLFVAFAHGWADGGAQNARIAVRVHFERGSGLIEAIDFYPNRETAAYVNMMHPRIIEEIIEFQSTTDERIDVYNGATVTTKALLAAVQEVLDSVARSCCRL
jgi:major membrane immunogen (membrane-anchored lipoprotein)